MPVAAIRYASPGAVPKDVPAYAAISYPTGSRVPGEVKRLECGLYLPTETVPSDRRKVGVVPYLPGDVIPADMRRIIPVRFGSVAYANAVLADSPVGYWRLGESSGTSAADASATGNTGTYAGGVTLGQAGALAAEPDGTRDTAALFDGTGRVSATTPTITNAYSVELWVYGTVAFSGKVPFALSASHFFQLLTGGQVRWNIRTDAGAGTDYTADSVGRISTGVWNHLVGTWDGSNSSLYINGAFDKAVAGSGTTTGLTVLRIGCYNANNLNITGYLDEVAVYATALSPARIAGHYAAGTGR